VIPDKLIQALDNLRFPDKVHFMNTRNIEKGTNVKYKDAVLTIFWR